MEIVLTVITIYIIVVLVSANNRPDSANSITTNKQKTSDNSKPEAKSTEKTNTFTTQINNRRLTSIYQSLWDDNGYHDITGVCYPKLRFDKSGWSIDKVLSNELLKLAVEL